MRDAARVSIVVTAAHRSRPSRRTIGWSLVIILLVLGGYALLGHLVTGQLQGRNVEIGELFTYLNLDNNGLLGIVLQITVIVIIPFVLMGQLLMRSGGSNFFNDAAIALMGRYRGGAGEDGGGRLEPVRHDLRHRRGEHRGGGHRDHPAHEALGHAGAARRRGRGLRVERRPARCRR